jgi:hypothetical protein
MSVQVRSVSLARLAAPVVAVALSMTAGSERSEASCFISLGTWVCSSMFISSEPVQRLQPAGAAMMSSSMLATANMVANNAANRIVGGPEIFPTGRIRTTTHDGFTPSANFDTQKTNGFNVDEWSAFASGSMQLPGTWFGGALRATVFGGANGMDVEARPRVNSGERPGQVGNTKTDANFLGGSLVWSGGGWYALTTFIGFWGDTKGTDQLVRVNWSHGIEGYVWNGVVGRVVDLGGPKLDLRASVSRTDFESDPFRVANGTLRSTASAWWLAFSPMLYQDFTMGGGTFRPYVQGTVKTLGAQDNRLTLVVDGAPAINAWDFRQHTTFWGGEVGFNYVQGNWTFGLAGYGERSKDEETWGGKIGASYRFN